MTKTARGTTARSTPSATEAPLDAGSSPDAPESGEVAQAVAADLAQMSPTLARSGMAAASLALARALDNPNSSSTSKSMCAKALLDYLDRLRQLTPADEEADDLDDLAARRALRLTGGATA